MRNAPYVVATGTLQGRSRSNQIWDTKSCKLKQRFTVSRTVELSSEGASKLVLTLESIGGSKNSPDEHVCETMEAWHGLACMCCVTAFGFCLHVWPRIQVFLP